MHKIYGIYNNVLNELVHGPFLSENDNLAVLSFKDYINKYSFFPKSNFTLYRFCGVNLGTKDITRNNLDGTFDLICKGDL